MNTPKEAKRILIYGDSNTFGWHEREDGVIVRHPLQSIWPQRLARALGDGVEVEVDGLSGRTTMYDRPEEPGNGTGDMPGTVLNGATLLPAALSRTMPLDLVIIMLGTNDFNRQLRKTAPEVAEGIGHLVDIVQGCQWRSLTPYRTPKVLVVCPVPKKLAGTKNEQFFPGADAPSAALFGLLKPLIKSKGIQLFNAGSVIDRAHDIDGIHFSLDDHRVLADALIPIVKQNLNL